MKQLDLEELLKAFEPLARLTDPETSHQAAEDAKRAQGPGCVEVLYEHFRCPKGLTDFELAAGLKRQQTSVGKRRGELVKVGYIAATEMRRPAPSGSAAIVWRITQKGSDAVRDLLAKDRLHGANGDPGGA